MKLYDEAHDYPRPIERLGPIIPGRTPRDHIHIWGTGDHGSQICRECGYSWNEVRWKEMYEAEEKRGFNPNQ